MADEPIIDAVGESRRSFVKKLVVGGFAVPVITTFTTSGITSAYAQTANSSGAVQATTTSQATTTAAPTTAPPTTAAPTTTTAAPTTPLPPPPTPTTTTTTSQYRTRPTSRYGPLQH